MGTSLNASLIALIAVLLSGPVLAQATPEEDQDRSTLQAAYVEFAPYIYTDEDGQATGSAKKLSERIAARAGYELQWRALPINRIRLYLKRGDVDLWLGIAGHPDLQEHILETRFPVATVNLSAYHPPHQPVIRDVGELRGKSLILISGYTYLGLLQEVLADPQTKHARAPHHLAGLQMLMMGRGDYLLNYDEPLAQAMKKSSTQPLLQRSSLLRREATFLVSRKTREAEIIVKRLNKAFQALVEEGRIEPPYPGMPY